MAENEDKWLPFCSLMQKGGAIIVEMQLLDALLQLFLCVCFFLFFLFNYISLPNIYPIYTPEIRAQIKAVHGKPAPVSCQG